MRLLLGFYTNASDITKAGQSTSIQGSHVQLCLEHAQVELKTSVWGAVRKNITVYLTDLAQKLLSLRIYSYLCAEIAISDVIRTLLI